MTLVHTEGSCYQKAGAQLFLTSDDEIYGLISGGCLEHDIVGQAKEVRKIQLPRLVYFDTGDPFDIDFGFGLGCGGKLWVFMEWTRSCQELHGKIISMSSQSSAEAIVVEAAERDLVGQRFFLNSKPHPSLPKSRYVDLTKDLIETLNSKKSQIKSFDSHDLQCQGPLKIALLFRSAQPALSIFGCGLGAWPLAMMAKTLGWELKVYDHRSAYLDDLPEQMANARLLDWAEASPFQCDTQQPSAAVVMTHNFNADRRILERLLSHPWSYLGLLGSHARSQRLLQELLQDNPKLSTSPSLACLHAPIGLDLGGNTPEAIALAIISEIQAVWHHRQQISYRSEMTTTRQGNRYAATH